MFIVRYSSYDNITCYTMNKNFIQLQSKNQWNMKLSIFTSQIPEVVD